MKTHCYALAVVLLSALAYARHDIIIEDADDLNRNSLAKTEFCSIVGQCNVTASLAVSVKAELVAMLKTGLDVCTKEHSQLQVELNQLKALTETLRKNVEQLSKPDNDFAEFNKIANLKPVLWLSGTYFDGYDNYKKGVRSGVASSFDALRTQVDLFGRIPVENVNGYMAYKFDKASSIRSRYQVGSKYTLITVFNFPTIPTGLEGRFFTTLVGNRLFAGYHGCWHTVYIEGWINSDNGCVKTTNKVIVILTNDNGVKNLWTQDRKIIANSRAGVADWGKTIIGHPQVYDIDQVNVNVYEAIVLDRALSENEVEDVRSFLKRKYSL